MKIEIQNITPTMKFKELKSGEVFIYGEEVLMKTHESLNKAGINAIYLEDGTDCYFAADQEITPVDATVQIR